MAGIINLNRARKAKKRAEAKAAAGANRARFGRTRAERDADVVEEARRDELLDGAKRED